MTSQRLANALQKALKPYVRLIAGETFSIVRDTAPPPLDLALAVKVANNLNFMLRIKK